MPPYGWRECSSRLVALLAELGDPVLERSDGLEVRPPLGGSRSLGFCESLRQLGFGTQPLRFGLRFEPLAFPGCLDGRCALGAFLRLQLGT